jgi:hypothetical protein
MNLARTPVANAPRHTGFALLALALLLGAAAPAIAGKGDCSQPVSTGASPAASDCLFILRVAVGTTTCSPACICAPLGALPTRTSDALLCLRRSVGQDVTLACPCGPPDGDDFNDNSKDPERWGMDNTFQGSGTIVETGGRLEFRSTQATGFHYSSRPWIASYMPYSEDWEASLDTTNLTSPTQDDEVNSFGISVIDERNFGSEVVVEMYSSHFDGAPARNGYYGDVFNDGDFIASVDNLAADQSSTDGAVRVTFDSVTKVLTLFYDADRTNGYQWTELGSFGVDNSDGSDGNTNWGMGPDDRFALAIYGYTEQMPIPAGQMYGDNFSTTGGVSP